MKRLRHPIRIGLGVIFLVLAVIGAFLPVLQGWIFLLLALIMFFPSHPRVAKVMKKIDARWPRLAGALRKLGVDEEGVTIEPQPPI